MKTLLQICIGAFGVRAVRIGCEGSRRASERSGERSAGCVQGMERAHVSVELIHRIFVCRWCLIMIFKRSFYGVQNEPTNFFDMLGQSHRVGLRSLAKGV